MTTTTTTRTRTDRRPCRACEELLSEPGADLCRPCGAYGPRGNVAEAVWLNGYRPALSDDTCESPEGCALRVDAYTAEGTGLCRWHLGG